MNEERKNRIKRMIASDTMVEGIVTSLNESLAQASEDTARKIHANPGFIAHAVDRLLDRMAPFFDSMDDESIAQATAFQESPAGKAYAICYKGIVQGMSTLAAEWMLELQGTLGKLP